MTDVDEMPPEDVSCAWSEGRIAARREGDADSTESAVRPPGRRVTCDEEEVADREAKVTGGDDADEATPDQVIEALLFSTDTPLNAGRLAELSGLASAREVRRLIEALNDKYAAARLSFRIEEIARGYQMLTMPAFRPWLAKLNRQQAQSRLSDAALETLSIIAYKQPVIRADIESIRGVGCGEVLNRLREMGLVLIMGRAEIVGRPMLYGTTRKFLDVFGLADLDDLPPMETLSIKRSSREAVTASDAAPQASEPDVRIAAAGA